MEKEARSRACSPKLKPIKEVEAKHCLWCAHRFMLTGMTHSVSITPFDPARSVRDFCQAQRSGIGQKIQITRERTQILAEKKSSSCCAAYWRPSDMGFDFFTCKATPQEISSELCIPTNSIGQCYFAPASGCANRMHLAVLREEGPHQ